MPAVSSAPIVQGPTLGGDIAEAAAQYPLVQQQMAQNQANIDATNIESASKRLSVLTKLISSNAQLAHDPQMVQATQRAFGALGMPAPLKNVNGVQSLDTEALFGFGPAADFMAQNLGLLLSFQPDKRAELIQTMTGQALPQGIAEKLGTLPQRMISTPSELSGLYNRATQAIDNLRYPGATVEGAISIIKPINQVLQMNGMPGIDLTDLEGAGLYQSLMNQAALQGLQGKAAEAYANTEYKKVETALAPEKVAIQAQDAQARTISAQASASRAASYAARTPAAIAKDYADADKAEADTRKLIQEAATGGASLKDLEANANNAQALVARLEADLNDPTQGLLAQKAALETGGQPPAPGDPNYAQYKQINDDAYEVEQRITKARHAAGAAQQAFQQGQAHLRTGTTPPGTKHHYAPQGAPTKTMPDGTVVYKGPDGYAHRDDNGQLYVPPKP